MNYLDVQDLLLEFTEEELARFTGDTNGVVIDGGIVDGLIKYAETLIDSYLSGVYQTPFQEQYPIIKRICKELTVVNLFNRSYKNGGLPNSIVWRKIEAMKLLEDLRKKKISLVYDEESKSAPIISNKSEADRVISKEELDQYTI